MNIEGKFKLLYADPPWSYNKKVGQGIADDQYNTMHLEDIKKLPINALMEENSVLILWATFPMLKEAFEVIEAWGLEYVTIAFIWIKLNDDGTPFFGIGHHTKSNSEPCLLCRKGKGLKVKDNTISSVILSKRAAHSRKPPICYSLIERMYQVKGLELFARERREGWGSYGNQLPKDTQKLLSLHISKEVNKEE